MTGTIKAKDRKKTSWQPSRDEEMSVGQPEDSPPAYHTMYPWTPPRPVHMTLAKETRIDAEDLTGSETKTEGKRPAREGEGVNAGRDKEKAAGGKQKDKVDQKTPIVKLSKEAKEKLLEKAHGARAALR